MLLAFRVSEALSLGTAHLGLRATPLPARTTRPQLMEALDAARTEFNVSTAVLAAGFAFEAYNEPSQNDARWERGADGIDVAFLSEEFAKEVYDGILEVRLCEARDLTQQEELAQALISGGKRDPYVYFAMNEESEDGPKEGAIGLGRAVDQVRSSTVWSETLLDKAKSGMSNPLEMFQNNKDKEGAVQWPSNEVHYLYVKEPSRAQLALTVFDEEVMAADIPLGATVRPLVSIRQSPLGPVPIPAAHPGICLACSLGRSIETTRPAVCPYGGSAQARRAARGAHVGRMGAADVAAGGDARQCDDGGRRRGRLCRRANGRGGGGSARLSGEEARTGGALSGAQVHANGSHTGAHHHAPLHLCARFSLLGVECVCRAGTRRSSREERCLPVPTHSRQHGRRRRRRRRARREV